MDLQLGGKEISKIYKNLINKEKINFIRGIPEFLEDKSFSTFDIFSHLFDDRFIMVERKNSSSEAIINFSFKNNPYAFFDIFNIWFKDCYVFVIV